MVCKTQPCTSNVPPGRERCTLHALAHAEARVAELEAALVRVARAHNGTHAEDCRAWGTSDEDLPEEPNDADPCCTCGATNERERARRIAKGARRVALASQVAMAEETLSWVDALRTDSAKGGGSDEPT